MDFHVNKSYIFQCILYLRNECMIVEDVHLANQIEQEWVTAKDGRCEGVFLKDMINLTSRNNVGKKINRKFKIRLTTCCTGT